MSQQSKSHGRKSISANLQPRALMTPSPQLAGVWTAQILTLFPEAFPGVLGESLTGRSLKDGKWALDTIDLRLLERASIEMSMIRLLVAARAWC